MEVVNLVNKINTEHELKIKEQRVELWENYGIIVKLNDLRDEVYSWDGEVI